MSSPKASPKSKRPAWFQDTKTSSEKQTDYFLKIRKLQKELINREQHNLVNAMERLKQLQYPRRRPMVKNFSLPESGASSAFPRRSYTRDVHRRKQMEKDKLIKPLKGKHLLPDRNVTYEEEEELASFSLEDIRLLYNKMLPVLNDKQIAKIASEVRSTFPNEPSTYLLQPHLPSIPNVKRKTTTRLVNRLKLLTLAEESQYRTLDIPKITSSFPPQKRNIPYAHSLPDIGDEKTAKKSKQRNILYFDIDPNDSSVFVHAACDRHLEDGDDDIDGDNANNANVGPLPPPNSRPNSHAASKKPTMDNETNVTESYDVSIADRQVEIEETTEKPMHPPAEVAKEENTAENDQEQQENKDVHVVTHDGIENSIDENIDVNVVPQEGIESSVDENIDVNVVPQKGIESSVDENINVNVVPQEGIESSIDENIDVNVVPQEGIESSVDENIDVNVVPQEGIESSVDENIDVNVVPQDQVESSVDVSNNNDKPSENQSAENVINNSDISQLSSDSQVSDITITEPKVVIKTNKPTVDNPDDQD